MHGERWHLGFFRKSRKIFSLRFRWNLHIWSISGRRARICKRFCDIFFRFRARARQSAILTKNNVWKIGFFALEPPNQVRQRTRAHRSTRNGVLYRMVGITLRSEQYCGRESNISKSVEKRQNGSRAARRPQIDLGPLAFDSASKSRKKIWPPPSPPPPPPKRKSF